jgi:hypothetical protein
MGRKPKVEQQSFRGANARTVKAEQPGSWKDARPVFCFQHADRGSKQSWKFDPSQKESKVILTFLCEMAGLSWKEIHALQKDGRPKFHSQLLGTLTRKAQKDAERMNLAETFDDEMHRFSLGGQRRLWGFRRDRTFHVVWWDPSHDVYPVSKRNT